MTKQEEIGEGLYDVLKKDILFYPLFAIPTRWLVNKILKYLHSQGVVIKVDRECDACNGTGSINQAVCPNCMGMPRRVAVEPLI